jgi:hypothetical protein
MMTFNQVVLISKEPKIYTSLLPGAATDFWYNNDTLSFKKAPRDKLMNMET